MNKERPLVLVTGGTGYIGSHTVVALQEKGYEVVIVDNLSNSYMEVLEGIEKISGRRPSFVKADLRQHNEVDALFGSYPQIRGVVHFAALKAVGESVEKPLDYYENNIGSLAALLKVMGEHQVRNMVFSSSCTVYGQPDELPVTEKAPVRQPESPYGNTKKISEEILRDVTRTGAVDVVSLRYFNPIGAHPSALIGELPVGPPNNLMPIVTQVAAGIRPSMTVFGNDYPTPDGTCIRDYIHVSDLAEAHVVALDRTLQGKQKSSFEVFNLGTGTGYSVLEVIEAFERATGVKLNYQIGNRRPGDVEAIYADATFSNHELGWKAARGLEEMVVSAWKWQQALPRLYPNLFSKAAP